MSRITNPLRNKVAIVAAHATMQGKHPDRSAWDLGVEAYRGALASSGIAPARIDGLLTQTANGGQMDPSRFGQMVGLDPKVTGALTYGTAFFSIAYAAALISSGQASVVACVYATNQRSHGFANPADQIPANERHGFFSAAGFAALGYQRYLHEYGRTADVDKLGAVAISQRAFARLNPIAFRRDPMSWDDYLQDRWIAWPLRRSDICLITDGGVALILADANLAADLVDQPVHLLGLGRQDALGGLARGDNLLIPQMRATATQLYERTGLGPGDVDNLQIQDAHASVILHTLENYGFCGAGEALDFIQDGRIGPGGPLPVNSGGGQLSEGYMVGWLHQVEAFRQLRGEAGERQTSNCRIAQFCATGGAREYSGSLLYGTGAVAEMLA